MQESYKIWSIGFWEYATDLWNLFDIAKSVLLLVSTSAMHSGKTLDDPSITLDGNLNDFSDIRTLAGGPDDTVDFLDIICGSVVVIVFLNVVIAIVSNAW